MERHVILLDDLIDVFPDAKSSSAQIAVTNRFPVRHADMSSLGAPRIRFGDTYQIGIVVRDLQESVERIQPSPTFVGRALMDMELFQITR